MKNPDHGRMEKRLKIVDALKENPWGLTADEIAWRTGLTAQEVKFGLSSLRSMQMLYSFEVPTGKAYKLKA